MNYDCLETATSKAAPVRQRIRASDSLSTLLLPTREIGAEQPIASCWMSQAPAAFCAEDTNLRRYVSNSPVTAPERKTS